MKTAYLIKTEPQLVNFDCDPALGLSFTNTIVDVTYLNNVVINGDLRIFVKQDIFEEGANKPVMWFLVISDTPMNNVNFQSSWRYVISVGAALQKYTQLGLNFTYQNAWTFPNIPDNWRIEETLVEFNKNGSFNGIYWDDPTQPTYEEDGEILRYSTMKSIKSDLVVAIGRGERLLNQSHHTHITVPGKYIQISANAVHQDNTVLKKIEEGGIGAVSDEHLYLQILYNKAISEEDIFLSFAVLYQMIEVVVSIPESDGIEKDMKHKIREYLKSEADLEPLAERVYGMLSNIKIQTTYELFELGIISLLGKNSDLCLQRSSFTNWRVFRGKLTHPKEINSITEEDFVKTYNQLRDFWTHLMKLLNGAVKT